MKKCIGCGEILNNDREKAGYTPKAIESSNYCMRCFKLKNYGQIENEQLISLTKEDIQKINQNLNSAVIIVVDLLNLDFSLENQLFKKIKRPIHLVFNKLDLLPKSFNYETIGQDLNDLLVRRNYKFESFIITTSLNNTFYDLIVEFITSINQTEIYLLGISSVGKSSFIKLMTKNPQILTSTKSGSTKKNIVHQFNEYQLIDMPGLIDQSNIQTNLTLQASKKIVVKKEIKPKVMQFYEPQTYYIEDFCAINVEAATNTSIVFYIPNQLAIHRRKSGNEIEFLTTKIKQLYKDNTNETNYVEKKIKLTNKEDLVINGLGFITVNDTINLKIYLPANVKIHKRKKIFRTKGAK